MAMWLIKDVGWALHDMHPIGQRAWQGSLTSGDVKQHVDGATTRQLSALSVEALKKFSSGMFEC